MNKAELKLILEEELGRLKEKYYEACNQRDENRKEIHDLKIKCSMHESNMDGVWMRCHRAEARVEILQDVVDKFFGIKKTPMVNRDQDTHPFKHSVPDQHPW